MCDSCRASDPGTADSVLDGFLQYSRRYMVSPFDARARIDRAFGSGKDILPQPRVLGRRFFAVKRIGQKHLPIPVQ